MKVIGFRNVRIERLNLPAGFRDRLQSPHVIERARSIERLGLLHNPVVRQSDYRLIAGGDRIAGCMLCGYAEVQCKMVECTDEELHEIEISENAHRRHSPEQQRKDIDMLLDLYENQIKQDPIEAAMMVKPPGAPKTARGLARLRVANELGLKPESVRRAEHRKKLAEDRRRQRGAAKAKKSPPPPINPIGMSLDDDFIAEVQSIATSLRTGEGYLRNVLGQLTAMRKDGVHFPMSRLDRLYELTQALSAEFRAAQPVSLCPYCKGITELQVRCTSCLGSGWINHVQSANVPQDLWSEGEHALVAYRSGFVKLSAYLKDQTDAASVEELFG